MAVEGNAIRGFAQLDPVAASIQAVYVAPASARRGIGAKLLVAAEEAAVALGLTRLTLDSSLNAVAFYVHAGYSSDVAATHELEPGVFIPCVTMHKTLHASSGA